MKSLSRSTLLVRTKMSKGGSLDVYMWLSSVSAVMVSGLGNFDDLIFSALSLLRGWGESGSNVAEEESPSRSFSCSFFARLGSSGEASEMVGRTSFSSYWLERTFWRMREGEKGVFLGGGGARKSLTVVWIAVVISAREVYGKQMFRTALEQY